MAEKNWDGEKSPRVARGKCGKLRCGVQCLRDYAHDGINGSRAGSDLETTGVL